jgi:hypothetical protein
VRDVAVTKSLEFLDHYTGRRLEGHTAPIQPKFNSLTGFVAGMTRER